MTYNAKQAKEQAMLPVDTVMDAEIIEIVDGTVKDFVTNLDNWKGEHDGKCINCLLQIKGDRADSSYSQIFTYREEGGKTIYSPNSNLGKYAKKYGKLPEVGDLVKVYTNSDGFPKLKLE